MASKTLRLDRHALFAQLGYVPHAGQWKVHESRAKRRVVACGTRWGKSTVAVHEALAYLLEPRERMEAWLVAPTYELTKRVFERVVAVLTLHMPHRLLLHQERDHIVRVANLGGGVSELRARSADKPAGLLGAALDVLIVDEADKVRDDVWEEYLAARTVDRDGRVLLISTPGSVRSWFYREYRRGGRDPEYASFAMPTRENPHVSADVIAGEERRLEPELFASQYEARFSGTDLTPCPTCKGPDESARASIWLRGSDGPRLCPDCGLIVHEDGSTAVAVQGWRGQDELYCSVVVLADETTNLDAPLPEYCRRVMLMNMREAEVPPELPEG